MPSKSPAQKKLMDAAAHTKGGYGGVPQKVGKEFVAADKGVKAHKMDGHGSGHQSIHDAAPDGHDSGHEKIDRNC